MTSRSDDERFQDGAQDYAAYLETPEGRLRTDLAFANLRDSLPVPRTKRAMYILDVGCGPGASAVRLASDYHVSGLDSSQAMLNLARCAAEEAGLADRVTLRHGDVSQLTDLFEAASFDVVLCHNILEYVGDPGAVLHAAARALRDTSAILSIVVRNQAGEVLKAAIQAGDLAAAEVNLTAEWGFESLYGGRVRLFTSQRLQTMLKAASLELIAERGIRVLADYLPPHISHSAEYARILKLERKLGSRPEFASVARYTQCLARVSPASAKPSCDEDPAENIA
jgi:S-adenosylmethionine-dependent methyltransferase